MLSLNGTGAWKKQLKDKAQMGYTSLHVFTFFPCHLSCRKFRLHKWWLRTPREQGRNYHRPGSGVESFPLCSGLKGVTFSKDEILSNFSRDGGKFLLTWEDLQPHLIQHNVQFMLVSITFPKLLFYIFSETLPITLPEEILLVDPSE